MEIVKKQVQDILELHLEGRLDAYWADHLSASIEDSIRQGFHQLQLNLANVDYLSSAGIRVQTWDTSGTPSAVGSGPKWTSASGGDIVRSFPSVGGHRP